jgi:asparagine synthase (glutamine-hydrolysing)
MTAFAAIVARGDARPDPPGVARVAQALAAIYQTPAVSFSFDACTLLTAPAHAGERFGDRHRGVVCVGHVVLEDPESLARELALPADSAALTLVADAYERWGDRCTGRLSGEYAFVIWDSRARRALAARDGLGLRPLYVGEGPNVIVLSNILVAALAYPAIADTLDEPALVEFLATGGMPPGRTVYRAINQLPAGHTVVIEGSEVTSMWRHWWFPQSARNAPSAAQDLLEGYRDVLERAVADRTRHDTRASILLSGGVDSTTIAAAARAATPTELHGFTAVYECVPGGGELALARGAAERLGIGVTPVRADSEEALHALRHDEVTPQPMDEPTLSGWRALIRSAGTHSGCALYGADGDALFRPPGLRGQLQQRGTASAFVDVIRYIAAHRRPPYLGLRVRERIGLARRPAAFVAGWLNHDARALLARGDARSILNHRPTPLPPHPTRPRTQELLETGVSEYLSSVLSPEVTRTAVELRCPLLDARVLGFVMSIPPVPWCQQKYLPRRAYRGVLPDAILDRPKTGLAGVDGVLARTWQQRHGRRQEPLTPAVAAWVDRHAWQTALESPDAVSVVVAWRVLQLDAWLTRRHELALITDPACTR